VSGVGEALEDEHADAAAPRFHAFASPWFSYVHTVGFPFLLAWGLGGWLDGIRVDPILLVPWLPIGFGTLLLYHSTAPFRWWLALVIVVLAAVVSVAVAGALPVFQLVVVAGVAALLQAIFAAVQCWSQRSSGYQQGGMPIIVDAAVILLALGWYFAALMVLDPRYRPTALDPPLQVTTMTSLPLFWGGGGMSDVLAGRVRPAAIIAAVAPALMLRAADSLDPATLRTTDILLLAHPPALAPATLVTIDEWVRGGGRAIVLADPLSTWPPSHPLGDPRNPPITSLLTPLLTHWGLELELDRLNSRCETSITDAGWRLNLCGTGVFSAANAACSIRAQGRIADCRIGRGRVLLLADADLLMSTKWRGIDRRFQRESHWRGDTPQWLADRAQTLVRRRGDPAIRQPLLRPIRPRS
jgi:hypothetical protein